jgi:hypothetical protein
MRTVAVLLSCFFSVGNSRRVQVPSQGEQHEQSNKAVRAASTSSELFDRSDAITELLLAIGPAAPATAHSRAAPHRRENGRLAPVVHRAGSVLRMTESDESAEDTPSDVDVEDLSSDVDSTDDVPSDVTFEDIVEKQDDLEVTPARGMTEVEVDEAVDAKKTELLTLGVATARGEAASEAEKIDARRAVEFLETQRPVYEISDACLGTWELVMTNTQLFRSSPFFMAGRAVCKDGEEADRYNWFCDMHRAALAISNIQRVRQVVSPTKIVSEFEVSAGAVPFVGEYFNVKYSGGLPFSITGAIVSTADIESTDGPAWRLFMDTVEVKGSNIPGLRQVLDSGVKLESRALGELLEENVDGYSNPKPEFRVTYVDDNLRISRDQDDNWFVYARTSKSYSPKNYEDEVADLGVGKLLDGLQTALLGSR